MKNTILAASVFSLFFCACGTKDNKNEAEHYPTYDTTAKMENINSGDPSNHRSNSPGNAADSANSTSNSTDNSGGNH